MSTQCVECFAQWETMHKRKFALSKQTNAAARLERDQYTFQAKIGWIFERLMKDKCFSVMAVSYFIGLAG